MKRKSKLLGIVGLAIISVVVILTIVFTGRYGDTYTSAALRDNSFGTLNWTNINKNNIVYEIPLTEMKVDDQEVTSDSLFLKHGSTLKLPIQIKEEGEYQLFLEYKAMDAKYMDCTLSVGYNGEIYNAFLPMIWADKEGGYDTDRYGNELNRDQVSMNFFVNNAVENSNLISRSNLMLPLTKEAKEITMISENQDLMIKTAYIVKPDKYEDYETYLKNVTSAKTVEDLIVIEGEAYNIKSDSFIRAIGIKNPVLSPYDTYTRKMNVVDGASWSKIGQKILWEFEVKEEGYYNIGFRYSQYSEANKVTFREIEIDGKVPFTEFTSMAFKPTNLNEYKNYILNDNSKDMRIYLTPGKHTIAMKAVIGPMEDAYYETLSIMQEISDMGMDLKKMTAGVSDKNRTWDMNTYLPDVPDKLLVCADRIDQLYEYLRKNTGMEPVFANDLTYASKTIRNLVKEPRTLPNKTELLNEGDNSVSSALGKVLARLTTQPLSIDRIYIFANTKLPKDKVSVFTSLSESVKSFAKTFRKDAATSNYSADYAKDSDQLQVWVNLSIPYTEILQQIVDANYNAKYGTNIQLSVMPNEQKLILANATGTNPDVAIGLNFYTPYEFAIRGAAKNLLEYDDFLQFYNDQYNLEALTPLVYDEGVYGAVDSINFQVLFYRKDILDKLGLSVPQTWDDVEHMMPELLRYSMNFNTVLANNLGFKTFNATGPFLYQNNGAFYEKDGLSTAFGKEETVNGFTQMTELFQIYALQEYVANFYNSFRYGEVPIGINGFSTYIQLQVAAPELAGKWDIAVVPGQRQEDGSILRYQAADNTASMIFENTDKEEEAWRFLTWWLSDETQVKFAYTLESTYGVQFRWNTANLEAFSQLPYPDSHKKVILEQLSYQKENARHPAGYMVERESSNIWNNVVANGKGLAESIDRSTITADREIIRKLKEFNFLDTDGNVIKKYPMNTIEKLQQELEKHDE
jgi:ABC-type glycerol-3-phosphate transport system substrate-binding protein